VKILGALVAVLWVANLLSAAGSTTRKSNAYLALTLLISSLVLALLTVAGQ
jgi:hypothetical protein